MTTASTSRDFDLISAVYDETRRPLDAKTLEGLLAFLHEHHWESLLEVGVGTGRIAQPLVEAGIGVVGIDASKGMLHRAAAKGVSGLVRGTAYQLPFADRSVDVALFVHVLHVLEDPWVGMTEAARVARHGVLAVMDRGPGRSWKERPDGDNPREVLRNLLAEAGYPDLLHRGPRAREEDILRDHPPDEVRLLSDREVTEPLSRQIDMIAKRAYRHVLQVPPQVLDRAVAAAREKVGDRTITFRRRESVVWWPME